MEPDVGQRRGLTTVLVLSALPSLVFTLPLLPADRLDAVTPVNKEFSEMVGWPDLADQVAAVYRGLPPDEQSRAVIFTGDYGEAGSLELYGPARGLPPVYSGHNSYADWGPPPDGSDVVIVVGIDPARLAWCADAETVGSITNSAGIENGEEGQPLTVCRAMTTGWSALWPTLRWVG